MSFDFSTLVTDRMQSDVDQRNAKGTYNAVDLNRVTAAMEALDELFQAYGYHSGYTPIFVASRGGPSDRFSARFIRFDVQGVRQLTNGLMQLSEIKFRTPDGVYFQFPDGASATASLVAASPGEGPEKLIDGLTSTKFCTDEFASGCQIVIDLGAGAHLDTALYSVWEWYTANDDANRDPVTFTLSVSADGTTYYQADNAVDADIPETRQALAYTGLVDIEGLPHGLPDGYTALEWLQGDGVAWINTDVAPNQETGVEVKFQTEQVEGACIIGVDTAWQQNGFAIFSKLVEFNTTPVWGNFYGTAPAIISVLDGRIRHDGAQIWGPSSDTFSCPYPLTMFCLNRSGARQEFLQGRIFWCRIYAGETMIKNFIPCKSPDDVLGMYDIINKIFYPNSGADGDFTAGPSITPPEPDPGPVLDPYTWYESDIPLQSQMGQYLANLAALRGVLSQAAAEPPTPESMALLTYVEANDIETILLQIEAVLTTIGAGFLRAGMPWAVSGGPEFFARNGGTA